MTMKQTFLTFGLAAVLTSPVAALAEDLSYEQVVLQGLDKVTGRLSTMTVKVGEKTHFGALDIYARVCYARPPEETPENSAFLEIVEKKEEGQLKLFSGWMFSSSPALSAMDHAVYDVWVLKCQGEQVKPPQPEPLVLENPIDIKSAQPKLKIVWDEEKQAVSDIPETIQEKPIDPEHPLDTEEAVVAAGEQENETIVIHVEQPQGMQADPAVIQEGEEQGSDEPQEFKLIPIHEEKTQVVPVETVPADPAVVDDTQDGGLFSEESEAMDKAVFPEEEEITD